MPRTFIQDSLFINIYYLQTSTKVESIEVQYKLYQYDTSILRGLSYHNEIFLAKTRFVLC